MCGIFCSYLCARHPSKRLRNRGPDHVGTVTTHRVALTSFVLHVQGIGTQPVSRSGLHLAFNGQLFDIPTSYTNDTGYLLDLVEKHGPLAAASLCKGPSTAIVYDEKEECLWFWRDYFGRRSLLISRADDGFVLSSVADSEGDWKEVPACGVFRVRGEILECFPYQGRALDAEKFCKTHSPDFTIHTEQPIEAGVSSLNRSVQSDLELDWKSVTKPFYNYLLESVRQRDACCSNPLTIDKTVLSDYQERHCFCIPGDQCNIHEPMEPTGARVAVLFSGGIDCTVLAYLLDKTARADEPIDLLNVSFGDTLTPDRISARKSLEDLQRTCQDRQWNLVEIDISKTELQRARDKYITGLVYPHNTVLDDSIGCALWFAARGAGKLAGCPVISSARLLFSGIGADELLGGYSRHRSAWTGGWEAVVAEVALDIGRIAERNLGRDNRVVGDHGRDSVAPFLDREFVNFVNSLPIQYKVDFTQERGVGEKMILRRVAAEAGLTSSSVLPKRAIQFGSRIAKLESKKEKGGDRCTRLLKPN